MAIGAKTGPTTTGRAGFFDYPALAAVCDRLFVMAWDLHWATSPAGPISDATWVQKIIDYIKTVPNQLALHHRHAALRLRLAARRQATPLEWDDMTALQARVGATTHWDAVAQEPYFTYTDTAGVSHTAYYANAQSVQGRLGRSRVPQDSASALWRLGDEDQETWNIPVTQPVKRLGDILAALIWRAMLGGYFLLLAGDRLVHQELVPARALARSGVRALQPLRDVLPALALQPLAALPPVRRGPDELPTVAVVIPAMNEQAAIETHARVDLRARLPAAPALGVRGRRRLDRRDLGAHGVRRAPLPEPARHPLLAQPRQARRDGGGHPRDRRARSSASSTPTRRSSPTRCARSSSRSATAGWRP